MSRDELPRLVVSDSKGNIFDHPVLKSGGRSGDRLVFPQASEWVPLPKGSQLFTLPGRIPMGWEEGKRAFIPVRKVKVNGSEVDCTSVAGFLPPGYIRTLLPATRLKPDAPTLPLWAYSSVGWKDGRFWASGLLVDSNPHWDPKYFEDDRSLARRVRATLRKSLDNRLSRQLAKCALDYHCFAAKNAFFRRWECPLPTSPTCNAGCIGCISLQPSECCPASMERINFVPTREEVVEIALPHLEKAEDPIVSFGQGCEGEPLMQWRLLKEAIHDLRQRTGQGTINLNTNGSLPDPISKLCKAGLDSLRVTLNSPNPPFYNRYHQPRGYTFKEVITSLVVAKERGIYTSINLLVFPGFTDRGSEIERLVGLIRETGLDLIQMRNLNIDPDLYGKTVGKGSGIGISAMISTLKKEFPRLQLGYFNRTKENF